MTRTKHALRIAELIENGTPFVQATVVRAQCPTSARPGDSAIVLADGSIEGFVGGQCAEGSVRLAALSVLTSSEPLLLRILPEDDAVFPESDGAQTVVNPCLSGGAIEVFLEPKLPAARVVIVGSTPIADSLRFLCEHLGYWVVGHSGDDIPAVDGAIAVLVSSHGRDETEVIRAALDAGVGYVGLVASRTRGAAVLDELRLDDDEAARVHTPVGLDIGARTAEEIGLSVLADVVRAVRRDGLVAPPAAPIELPATAIDPVCGMTVVVSLGVPHLRVDDVDYWFCNPGCRTRHAEDLGLTP